MTPDFSRIANVRPGYGYAGIRDPHMDDLAPADSGIFHVDLTTAESKLIVPLAQVAAFGKVPQPAEHAKHYFICFSVLTDPVSLRCIAGAIRQNIAPHD